MIATSMARRVSRMARAKPALWRSNPCVFSASRRITPSSAGLARPAPKALIQPHRVQHRHGDVDPVDPPVILAAILKVVDDLKRGAQRIVHAQVARSSPCTSSTKRPTGMADRRQ
jgi:hypothetical protein